MVLEKNKYLLQDDACLEKYAKDGRLTEPSDGRNYRWRDMIEKSKKLNRPLTDSEAESFRIY